MDLGAEVPLGQRQIINNTFENERDRLLAFIRQRVPTVEDAEDILQDVFAQLVDRYDTIESIERVSSWLFSVARNKITDSYRKKKPTNFSQLEKYQSENDDAPLSLLDILPDLSTGPERAFLKNKITEVLGVALEKLPEDQREVFVLHEFENKSFKEISKMTGVGVNTLLSRKRYAILALRKSMENVYQEL